MSLKCIKCSSLMKSELTRKGVLVDRCSACRGVWLDPGEINFFSQNPIGLRKYQKQGLEDVQSTSRKCPQCHSTMGLGRFPGFSFQVEECLSCKGLYWDAYEFEKLQNNKVFKGIKKDSLVSLNKSQQTQTLRPFRVKLPSLALTTWMVCGTLYGILFGFLVFFTEYFQMPLFFQQVIFGGFILCILLQFYFSPILLDWQLKWLGSLKWTPLDNLPDHFKASLQRLCQKYRIPIPRVGIIQDGSPQAYTYGRTPYSARLVFSEGMFQLLDPDEVEAVLAHELGHIKHWDFVIMTVIKIVPIILYNIYSSLRKSSRSSRNKKGKGLNIAAVIIAYIAYMVSEYLVLFVSRVREYYADRFSCFATKKPNKLLTALVKISYGFLGNSSEKDQEYKDKRKSIEALNIMNMSQSKHLALAQTSGQGFTPESIQEMMRWDLWNPWAFFYEWRSTHPLTAKRINAIGSYALALKQKPYLVFKKEKPESYWDEFAGDVFILFLPYILAFVGAVGFVLFNLQSYGWESFFQQNDMWFIQLFGLTLLALSLGSLIKTVKAYPAGGKRFFSCSISALLKVVKVSPVRSYPVVLKGEIIGRGQAGQIFSEDFFLKDKTGMIFLDHEPFGLNVFFAFRHFEKFQGREVTVQGWYRRAPSPYLEVWKIQSPQRQSKAYTYIYKIIFGWVGIVLGLLCVFYSFSDSYVISGMLQGIVESWKKIHLQQ